MKNLTFLLTVSLSMIVIAPRMASAQTARSLEQLEVLLKPGDTVLVTESDGKVFKGRIDTLSSSLLKVKSKGVVREFPETRLLEIRHSDSLRNGAKYGAAVGAGFGGLGLLGACLVDDCGFGAAFAATWTGIGAGIGVGIDAMVGRHKTIYRAKSAPVTRYNVSPILKNRSKGVLLSMSF